MVQACTQAPFMDRDDTAKVLGLLPEKVRIIPAAAGGGFGAKLDLSVQPLIGLAVLKTGKPCRMVFTRNESMQATTKRHPGTMTATIGADGQGRITGMTFHGDFNTGAYASWGPTVATRVPVHACGPYRTPNYRATSRAIHTHGPTAGAFRGFGVPQAAICQEVLYDELAEKCGMDRLAFRRLNALSDGDQTPCGQVLSAVGIADCLQQLQPHWDRALGSAQTFNKNGEGETPRCRDRLVLVWLWQHRVAKPLDDPHRHHAARAYSIASGCHGCRPGCQHSYRADRGGRSGSASGGY